MPATCSAPGTSPKKQTAVRMETITPIFMNSAESVTPLTRMSHW